MNDMVYMILTMAFGACLHRLFQMIVADMGGMPRMPRRGDEDEKTREVKSA